MSAAMQQRERDCCQHQYHHHNPGTEGSPIQGDSPAARADSESLLACVIFP